MRTNLKIFALLASTMIAPVAAFAGQAPGLASDPDIPISHKDRVYAAEQFSNTVSVADPASNKLVGVIRLGDPQPGNLSPLYHGEVLVHGMGFSPDRKTIAVVSIGSNSVSFIDTATNAVKHGALSNAAGCIAVSWHIGERNGVARLHFSWTESKGPPVAEPTRKGVAVYRQYGQGLFGTSSSLSFMIALLVIATAIPLIRYLRRREAYA